MIAGGLEDSEVASLVLSSARGPVPDDGREIGLLAFKTAMAGGSPVDGSRLTLHRHGAGPQLVSRPNFRPFRHRSHGALSAGVRRHGDEFVAQT
jgi:hypothetical protein